MLVFSPACFAAQPVKTAAEAIALVKQCWIQHDPTLPELKEHWYARKMTLHWRVWSGKWGGGNWELSNGIHYGFALDSRPDPDWCLNDGGIETAAKAKSHN